MAGDVANFKFCSPLKQLSGLKGNYHAIRPTHTIYVSKHSKYQPYMILKTLKFKISGLILTVVLLTQNGISQCTNNYNQNGANVSVGASSANFAQGFTADCDGKLESVAFISNSTGTVSAGTLNIYSGNNTTGTPMYTQSYSPIAINNIGDLVKVDITGTIILTENAQYTFELTIDNVNILADYGNGYSGGSAFQQGMEVSSTDILFEVSVVDIGLFVNQNNWQNEIILFPNPTKNYLMFQNLKSTEEYSVFNTTGKIVLSGTITENEQIDLENLSVGLYFLHFDNGTILKFNKE